jgi:hypothetical protein
MLYTVGYRSETGPRHESLQAEDAFEAAQTIKRDHPDAFIIYSRAANEDERAGGPVDTGSQEAGTEHKLALWALEPCAHPDDPRWQDRTIWKRLIIAAASPAFARLAAETWAKTGRSVGPGNESLSAVAGFSDELLYTVKRIEWQEMENIRHSPGVVLAAEPADGR